MKVFSFFAPPSLGFFKHTDKEGVWEFDNEDISYWSYRLDHRRFFCRPCDHHHIMSSVVL